MLPYEEAKDGDGYRREGDSGIAKDPLPVKQAMISEITPIEGRRIT
jgi:hypothetical protein